MTPGHTQNPEVNQIQKVEPPSPGDLPPEFLQETQAASGNEKIPPPPRQPPMPPSSHNETASPSGAPGTPPMVPSSMPGSDAAQVPEQRELETSAPVVPQFASDEQYTYDPAGHRDPFRPFKNQRPVTVTGSGSGSANLDSADPLQKWDLDRFTVVAIMWEIRLPKAMVKDPDGKMYMIGKSSTIGRNSGQVVAIREGEVVVVETVENEGVQTKEVKILELKK
jgi:type IV pilus assembly protein PilP